MKLNIFAKRINNIISIVFNGKPKTIKPESDQDMRETLDLIKKANEGDENATEKLKNKINKPIEEILPEISCNFIKIKEEIEVSEVEYKEAKIEHDTFNLTVLDNHNDFEIVEKDGIKKYYLKGFKADLPDIIVRKFIQLIEACEDFNHLISFWQMNLLNNNEEARRGLYKFITKQKLIVTGEGYFVAFRRLLIKNNSTLSNTIFNEDQLIQFQLIVNKVKKWKQSMKKYDIYSFDGNILMIDNSKNKDIDNSYKFLGTLYDLHKNSSQPNIGQSEDIYTDNFTQKMTIKLNETVKLSRENCDSNSNKSCSKGLHVGTESFVSKESSFGDIIVAVLVNPQHVISVPYSDAHKMRVCEYYPFMILSPEDLKSFGNMDISKYELAYKEIEQIELQKALDVIDELTDFELKEFSNSKNVKNAKELDDMQNNIKDKKNALNIQNIRIKSLLDDDISKSLDINEVRTIIKNRLK